jgi:hypothetical protein
MSDWRHWAYPFPADRPVELVWDVFSRVPTKFGAALDWNLTDKFVVATDVNAAVYLRLAFGDSRLMGTDSRIVLDEHEVLISASERTECKTLLQENCSAEVNWFSIIIVHAHSDEAWRAFDEAYRAVIGNAAAVI